MFQMSGSMSGGCDTLQDMSNERKLIALLKKLMSSGAGQPPPSRLGLSVTQVNIIDEIAEAGNLSIRELSLILQLTPPTVSVAVRDLADGGFLQKTADSSDGRVRKIKLTGKARSLHKKIEHYRLGKVGKLLNHLDEQEQSHFIELLSKALE